MPDGRDGGTSRAGDHAGDESSSWGAFVFEGIERNLDWLLEKDCGRELGGQLHGDRNRHTRGGKKSCRLGGAKIQQQLGGGGVCLSSDPGSVRERVGACGEAAPVLAVAVLHTYTSRVPLFLAVRKPQGRYRKL